MDLPDFESGKRVAEIVSASGLGRGGVAKSVGCALGSVNNWKNGTMPSKEFLWWARTQGYPADYVLFGVRDDGQGIPESLKPGMQLSDMKQKISSLPIESKLILSKFLYDQVYNFVLSEIID